MSTPVGFVSRGALKLEAALRRFGLDVRGARALDVGASTGGFTDVLLARGAARVTAIDVGHGQLHPRLRDDPRVESLEGANFKTLALDVAPGPYDAFVVDVSFVAARSMLRPLAFRLRPGAEGVVLLKPQFELPDRLVRGGKVDDPALRARALEAFRARAEPLGFRVLAHVDSPVAGGAGTIEILLHVRFEGRTARLPERRTGPRPAADAPAARPAPAVLSWFAVAAPGLEEVVRQEVAALPGVQAVRLVEGGVEFDGPLALGMRANLGLRVATRVLLRLGEVEARRFPELRSRLAKLPWKRVLPPDRPLRIEAAAARCRLYHTGALAENLALAIADRHGPLAKATAEQAEEGEASRVLLRGRDDRFTVSVDASGQLLHRRGWRIETGRAPLRETLAAGVLLLCGFDPERPFVDPMCGAGTIALEACALALRVAPGLARSFAFERWPSFDPAAWDRLRDEALAAIRDAPPAPLHAFDRDERAVEIARRNAGRAGFLPHLTIERAAFGDRRPPPGPGLVVLNPPYGRRLAGGPARLLREVGRTLRADWAGWRAGVIVPDPASERALALGGSGHALRNGGLRVRLVVAEVPRPVRPRPPAARA